MGQQGGKLLAAQAADDVGIAQHLLDGVSGGPQGVIAGLVDRKSVV